MPLEIFSGDHLPTLLARIRESLGPDACVVQLRRRGSEFELIASDGSGGFAAAAPSVPSTARPAPTVAAKATPASPFEPAPMAGPDFRDVLSMEVARPALRAMPAPPKAMPKATPPAATPVTPAAPPPFGRGTASDLPARAPFMVRPWVVALVGPTGAGKTTTIAKLATNRLGFGGSRVGLIGLDTYRVGAVEQLETYADLADLPIEIVYSEAEAKRALARLNQCEVVLIDTPGRGPRNAADTEIIRGWLAELAPDEVHLTLPAGQLPAVTRRLLRSYASFGVTHLLATKLDEYPIEQGIFDVAHEHDRRMRWITNGQEVPADLRAAAESFAAAAGRRLPGALESVA